MIGRLLRSGAAGAIGAALLAAAPTPLAAKALTPLSREGEQCLATGDAARGDLRAMEACVEAERAKQDRLLNAAYRRAMASQPPAGKARLLASERAWLRRLPAWVRRCALPWGPDGHEYPVVAGNCEAVARIERRRWLEAHYRAAR